MQGNIILNSHRTAARPAAGKRRVKENGKEGTATEGKAKTGYFPETRRPSEK